MNPEKHFEKHTPEFKEASESAKMKEKQEIYRKILGFSGGENPDMLLVLDAGIATRRKPDKSDRLRLVFVPTSYEDESALLQEKKSSYNVRETGRKNLMIGTAGGKARCLAAKELWEVFPETDIMVDSRFPVEVPEEFRKEIPEIPSEHYTVYKDYLNEMGIPKDKIQEERESTTTFEGVINFLSIAIEKRIKRPVIITNKFHLPRTAKILELLSNPETAREKLKYLLAKLPKNCREKLKLEIRQEGKELFLSFSDNSFFENLKNMEVKTIAAEDILVHRSPHYKKLFEEVEKTEAYKTRIAFEESGVKQLEEGTYGKPKDS